MAGTGQGHQEWKRGEQLQALRTPATLPVVVKGSGLESAYTFWRANASGEVPTGARGVVAGSAT